MEYRRAFSESKVFIVGTSHFSKESQRDVRQTIHETQPALVMVELCPSRTSIFLMDEKERFDQESSELDRSAKLALIYQVIFCSYKSSLFNCSSRNNFQAIN